MASILGPVGGYFFFYHVQNVLLHPRSCSPDFLSWGTDWKICGRLDNKTQCAVHGNCIQTKYPHRHIKTEVWELEGLGWTLSTSLKWPFSWNDQHDHRRVKVWHWQLLNQKQETQTHLVVFFTLTDLPLPWSTATHYKSIFSPVFKSVIISPLICGVDFPIFNYFFNI